MGQKCSWDKSAHGPDAAPMILGLLDALLCEGSEGTLASGTTQALPVMVRDCGAGVEDGHYDLRTVTPYTMSLSIKNPSTVT